MALHLIRPDVNIDFVGKRKFFVLLSTAINIAALLLLIFKGLNYGVDFAGGTVVQIKFAQHTSANQLRDVLGQLKLGDVTIQDFGSTGYQYLVRFDKVANLKNFHDVLLDTLDRSFGKGDASVLRVESVGARVGKDLRRDAIGAVVVATIFMGCFIAWEFRNVSWSFGSGAVIALVHDILVVVGALVISQFQFDLTTLAALLTVIGYSVHDTIIVSDRIREDALKRRRDGLPAIMNRAINETLSRTILTSGVAIVVLVVLLALGGPILRPSAFTLLVGFITGTYSSIYIAGPVVLFWERRVKIKALSTRAA